jgi:hypothetical protein
MDEDTKKGEAGGRAEGDGGIVRGALKAALGAFLSLSLSLAASNFERVFYACAL